MGFLSVYAKTVKLDLGALDPQAAGFWIEYRPYLTAADYDAADAKLGRPSFTSTVRAGAVKSEADVPISVGYVQDTAAYREELVVRAIVGWNLTDENEQPLPLEFNPDDEVNPTAATANFRGVVSPRRLSVRQLPQYVHSAIYEAVTEASNKRSTQETARFPG